MALLTFDSVTTYATSPELMRRWPQTVNPGVFTTGRRANTGAWRMWDTSQAVMKDFPAASSFIVGMALYAEWSTANGLLLSFRTAAGEQISLRTDANHQLYVSRNGTTLWSSGSDTTYRLSYLTWRYVEFKAVFDGTTGSWALRMDGANSTLVTQTNVNTAAQGGTTATQVRFGGGNETLRYTDIYICDSTGPAPHNDFLGDCRVDVMLPSANGTYADMTRSTGTNDAALLDDLPTNEDTDYIFSNTLDHKTSVQTADLPYTPTHVYGVMVTEYSRKDNTGGREITSFIRTNANDYFAPNAHVLSTGYTADFEIWPTNPNTGVAFTPTEVNNLEIGVKVTG